MNLLRLSQHIQRVFYVYCTSLPGNYQAKRRAILREMTVKTIQFLSLTSESYWMDFGTLLGFYREGDILAHDIDVDFAMMEDSYQKVLSLKHLLPKDFKLYDTSYKHRGPKLYLSYKGFDVDIYFYEDQGSSVRSYEDTKWKNEVQEIPKGLIFPLANAFFLDEEVAVPAKVKPYLEYLYGYIGSDAVRDRSTGFWSKRI